MKVRKFVDSVAIHVAAGDGGNGCVSFRREKFVPKGGPDGGDGGRGGHVKLQADPNTDSLLSLFFNPQQRAEDGGHGKGKKMYGRCGRDLVIKIPCGTEVWDVETEELVCDLLAPGEEVLIAHGGKGGLGNPHWQTSTHQTPYEHTDGMPGEERNLRLELKLLADVGLIGLPNSGKSTLISVISAARPKIADYPFTTLAPNLGVVACGDAQPFVVADIPGLIEGAHEGAGLGIRFLKHVERTRVLAHVVDLSQMPEGDPLHPYRLIERELRGYSGELAAKERVIVLNKADRIEDPRDVEKMREAYCTLGHPVFVISALHRQGLVELVWSLMRLVSGLE